MKTILHPDYWIEIPAGEFLIGLSDEQRALIGWQPYLRSRQEWHGKGNVTEQ
jgi:hypothetical protein